uniref:Rabaptin, RAB GTPase binding effector protein 2 n=1 Tax=Mus musculus TaxID=10090 RepID=D6RGR2_MOUSE
METMKAVAEVSESTKAEAVAAVQRQCQEEVASLQAILKVSFYIALALLELAHRNLPASAS